MKYLFYPIFGISVLGGYGGASVMEGDVSTVAAHRSTIPQSVRGTYRTAPITWRTGFHGPNRYVPSYSGGSSGGGSYGGGGGFGYGGK